jgi:hypothetical protein
MAELSPAAQAVLNAFLDTPGEVPLPMWDYGRDLAAALRAAADQVVPDIEYEADCLDEPAESELQCIRNRNRLLAIAAELEAQ